MKLPLGKSTRIDTVRKVARRDAGKSAGRPIDCREHRGKRVGAGEAGGEALELPPGQYKVVITAADEEVVANPVTIPPGGETTLTLALKDGRFVLVRQ